ncbi:MAG TPA: Mth938-like domain-containing protein [Alphaproteobacteria bacterium]
MVDITPLIKSDRKVIQAYKNGVFKISNEIFQTPVIVFPDRVEIWPVEADQIIQMDDDKPAANSNEKSLSEGMAPVIFRHKEVEFLMIGTGHAMHPLQPALKKWLQQQGIRCEFMDTGAACRTYNVLLAEGRLVAAALLPSL